MNSKTILEIVYKKYEKLQNNFNKVVTKRYPQAMACI